MHPFFEFVLALVAFGFAYKLLAAWMAHRRTEPRADEPRVAEWQRRLDVVEERVRVLERIVTDERYDLKQQFKDLGA